MTRGSYFVNALDMLGRHIALFVVAAYASAFGLVVTLAIASVLSSGGNGTEGALISQLGNGALGIFSMRFIFPPYVMAAIIIWITRSRSPLIYAMWGGLIALAAICLVVKDLHEVWIVVPAGMLCGLVCRWLGAALGLLPQPQPLSPHGVNGSTNA